MAELAVDHSPQGTSAPGRYTILLNGRDREQLRLTYEEAWSMHLAGIRFSIFDPINSEYNVSRPYTTIYLLDRDTLTFVQEPLA